MLLGCCRGRFLRDDVACMAVQDVSVALDCGALTVLRAQLLVMRTVVTCSMCNGRCAQQTLAWCLPLATDCCKTSCPCFALACSSNASTCGRPRQPAHTCPSFCTPSRAASRCDMPPSASWRGTAVVAMVQTLHLRRATMLQVQQRSMVLRHVQAEDQTAGRCRRDCTLLSRSGVRGDPSRHAVPPSWQPLRRRLQHSRARRWTAPRWQLCLEVQRPHTLHPALRHTLAAVLRPPSSPRFQTPPSRRGVTLTQAEGKAAAVSWVVSPPTSSHKTPVLHTRQSPSVCVSRQDWAACCSCPAWHR
jgi:hypothetical protein